MVVYCWRTGVIGLDRRAPKGALGLVKAPGRALRRAVEVCARHGYRDGVLLVPGLPEASDDVAAMEAAKSFRDQIRKRLAQAEGNAP